MKKSIKFALRNLLFILFSMGFGSCKKQMAETLVSGEAKVRFTNAVHTEAPQEIVIDNQKENLNSLPFGETSPYLKISSGSRNIAFTGSTATTKETFNFTPSLVYSTFLIADKIGARSLVNYEVNLSNVETSKVKIRFINLSPNFLTGLNVSVAGGTLFVNALMFKEASNYFSIDPGLNLNFKIVGSSSIKTIKAAEFEVGKIYSIWFSGINTNDLEAHLIENN